MVDFPLSPEPVVGVNPSHMQITCLEKPGKLLLETYQVVISCIRAVVFFDHPPRSCQSPVFSSSLMHPPRLRARYRSFPSWQVRGFQIGGM